MSVVAMYPFFIIFTNANAEYYIMKRIISTSVCILLLAFVAGGQNYQSRRPEKERRMFVSEVVENEINEIACKLKNPYLRWMFINCFPNTLDTTVHPGKDTDGNPRTFVYTGDIPAMWLRDSGGQIWPYVHLASKDKKLAEMIAGVIRCQFSLINIDPYANAFNDGPTGAGEENDDTGEAKKPEVFERKWEIDSHCYPVRLAYGYWKETGDTSIFDKQWLNVVSNILTTFKTQQKKKGNGPYYFLRVTDRQLDTKARVGLGHPVKPVGLIASSFRPSDDATQFEFLVPSNFFAVDILRKAAEILQTVNRNKSMANQCEKLADEVENALKKYAIVKHPKYGNIYAFEVDGYGNNYMMDDANVPSLLSLGYLIPDMQKDPIYQNTRKFVWSESNPYFWKGTAGEGIGGPHIKTEAIWPMSIMMKAFTAKDDDEIRKCIVLLMTTDAGTGFIHESFDRNNAADYTRPWFAWQNSLFGELIVTLVNKGKLDVLNSIK